MRVYTHTQLMTSMVPHDVVGVVRWLDLGSRYPGNVPKVGRLSSQSEFVINLDGNLKHGVLRVLPTYLPTSRYTVLGKVWWYWKKRAGTYIHRDNVSGPVT